MSTTQLHWSGPYALIEGNGDSIIYDLPEAATAGVYLWALPIDGRYLIHYVGIANHNVATRQIEHMQHYLAGNYTIYDPKLFSQGQVSYMYQPKHGLVSFMSRHRELSDALFDQVRQLRVFFVPMAGADRETLERIESALIEAIRQTGGRAEVFLDNMRISRRVPVEERVTMTVHDPEKFEGMPKVLAV